MIITRHLANGDFEAEVFGEGIVAQGPTLEDVVERIKATMGLKQFAAWRLKAIKNATHVAFDPQLGSYVADCPAVGIRAQGFTRQDAWDRFLHGLTLADKARAAAATETLPDAVGADAPTEEIDNAEVS